MQTSNLDLNSNEVNDKCAEHLSDALKNENCKLTNLFLNSNKIHDEGDGHLCNALENENCKLTELDLRFNLIDKRCVTMHAVLSV